VAVARNAAANPAEERPAGKAGNLRFVYRTERIISAALKGARMNKVTVEEVENRLSRGGDITLVDARSAEAWSKSDIKAAGAIRIPPDNADDHTADVSRDDYIVTYCT